MVAAGLLLYTVCPPTPLLHFELDCHGVSELSVGELVRASPFLELCRADPVVAGL